jgi:tripartite-type tricarboxylate transporter receptor subunit TctC
LNSPKTKEKLESQGALIFQTTPEEHAAYLQAEAKLLSELIKAVNPAGQ